MAGNALNTAISAEATLTVNAAPFITLSTLAGLAGTGGSSDGLNTNALFNHPYGIAVDSHTNVYVADMYNDVIRMLSPSGAGWMVSTIAGKDGSAGSANGVGTNAQFHAPFGIAVDGSGNLFVTDTRHDTIEN